jgi:hypothetical protein
MLQASEYNLIIYIVNAEAEVNKAQHKSLLMLPVIILNIFFSI